MSTSKDTSLHFRSQPRQRTAVLDLRFATGYGLVLVFVFAITVLILAHAGAIVSILYPLFAFLLAASLFRYQRAVYVAFTWWIWLFSPEVRRLVDYQSGYHSISPVMATPLLVTLLSTLWLLQRPKMLLSRSIIPFSLFGMVLVYGLAVGAIRNGLFAAIYDFVDWILPLGFCTFLLVDLENFATNRVATRHALMLGLLGISSYGLYQFYHFPPWDAYWLQQSELTSSGPGAAEQVRLFGPLNSAGPYGLSLMVALLFAQASGGPLTIIASVLGYPAFALSLVRAAWGGWIIGMLYILARAGGRTKLRMIIFGTITFALALPLVTVGPVADALSKRFATFYDIQQDGSYNARQLAYDRVGLMALSEPIGSGLGGSTSQAVKLGGEASAAGDAGLLYIPIEFGWVGGAAFTWAIGWIMLRAFRNSPHGKDPFSVAASGGFLAMLWSCAFANNFSGVDGMAFWACAGLGYQSYLVDRT